MTKELIRQSRQLGKTGQLWNAIVDMAIEQTHKSYIKYRFGLCKVSDDGLEGTPELKPGAVTKIKWYWRLYNWFWNLYLKFK